MEKESLLKFISGFIIIPTRNYEIREYGSIVREFNCELVQQFNGSMEKWKCGEVISDVS
jgi:hypothetical protein